MPAGARALARAAGPGAQRRAHRRMRHRLRYRACLDGERGECDDPSGEHGARRPARGSGGRALSGIEQRHRLVLPAPVRLPAAALDPAAPAPPATVMVPMRVTARARTAVTVVSLRFKLPPLSSLTWWVRREHARRSKAGGPTVGVVL